MYSRFSIVFFNNIVPDTNELFRYIRYLILIIILIIIRILLFFYLISRSLSSPPLPPTCILRLHKTRQCITGWRGVIFRDATTHGLKHFPKCPSRPSCPLYRWIHPLTRVTSFLHEEYARERKARSQRRVRWSINGKANADLVFFVANARVEEIKRVSRQELRDKSWSECTLIVSPERWYFPLRAFERTTMRVYHTWLLDLAHLYAENIINWEFNATPLDIYAQIE